jgi:Bax protein
MIGVFERSSLAFLAGTVVLAVGGALLSRSPEAPVPEPKVGKPAQTSVSNELLAGPAFETDFVRLQYDLAAVAAGAPVPRVFAAAFPESGEGGGSGMWREDMLRTILPLVLLANEDILAERRQLWSVRFRLNRGERLPPEQRIWLEVVAERYAAAADDLDELARRVDVVPPSIVLAMAGEAMEKERHAAARAARSGGPTGSAADRSLSSKHIPREMSKVSMPSLARSPLEHVRALIRALNTAPAYQSFRRERERLRMAGEPLDSLRLADTLPRLRNGQPRAEDLSALITTHRLTRFDNSRLEPSSPAG